MQFYGRQSATESWSYVFFKGKKPQQNQKPQTNKIRIYFITFIQLKGIVNLEYR